MQGLPQVSTHDKAPFMPRYAIQVEYDGAPFHGWQRQTDLPSIQGAIEHALTKLEPGPHKIAAAGRTDKGVHGLAQVAHCDLERDWTPFRLSEALNYHLKPNPISIVNCAAVPETFHARFSATERRYLFRIIARRAPLTHSRGFVWQVKQPLNVNAMLEGASHLLGKHDFTTFSALSKRWIGWTSAKSKLCTVPKFILTCAHDHFCTIRCVALLARWNVSAADH